MVIYGILNKLSGKYYIGSAINFSRRKRQHLKMLKEKNHHSYLLQKDWKENLFEFIILENVKEKENLIQREQWWIDNTQSFYNICKIANSSLGIKRTKETKEKVRQANLGLKHPDWRNKIKSISQGGKNHWTKNKSFSEESKKKMSDAQKELYKNGYVHPNKKKIIQYSLSMLLIKEWESAADAERVLGISRFAIAQVLRGHNKTSGGYIWKYNNNNNNN